MADPFATERYREMGSDAAVYGEDHASPYDGATWTPYTANQGMYTQYDLHAWFRDTISKDRIKPCEHYKTWGRMGYINGGQPFYGDHTQIVSSIPYDNTIISHAMIAAKIGSPYGASFSSAALEAFIQFHTQVDSEADLPLTLLTLRDLYTLAVQIEQFALAMRKFLEKDFDPNWGLWERRRRLGPFINSLVSGFLGYNLGYKPSAADAYALGGVYWHVLQRLEFLRKSFGRPTPLNFSRTLSGFPLEDRPTGIPPGPGLNTRLVMGYQTCEFRAHTTLTHKLSGLDSPLAMLRALGAGTGFGNPLYVLWDKIPYSFVIDWALKFSSVLKLIAFQPFQGSWELTDTHYTLKHWGTIDIWEYAFPGYPHNQWVFCGQRNFRHFLRGLGLPVNVGDLLALQPLSGTQQALIGALLASKFGRR